MQKAQPMHNSVNAICPARAFSVFRSRAFNKLRVQKGIHKYLEVRALRRDSPVAQHPLQAFGCDISAMKDAVLGHRAQHNRERLVGNSAPPKLGVFVELPEECLRYSGS